MIRDLSDDEARAALPLKWGVYGPDVIPAWVAEMDYALAPELVDALTGAVRGGMAGYALADHQGVGASLAGFAARHWGWDLPASATTLTGDVISGIRLALEVLCPPGPVVVQLPCYPPFRELVALAGRELVGVGTDPDAPLDHAGATLDLAAVEQAFAAGGRTLLLCNPHNPLGHVPTRAELEAVRDLAAEYGARVVADEIHGPLALPGARFTPYLSVDPGAILVTSASKSFNTAGLHCAQLVTLDAAEQHALRHVPLPQNHGFSPLGIVAARVAYDDCDAWLASLVARLDAQRTLLGDLLAEHLPAARMRPLEATYLAWLDLRAYGFADPAAAARAHGVAPAPGSDYQPGLAGHVRLNVATSPARLTEAVRRLGIALAETTGRPPEPRP